MLPENKSMFAGGTSRFPQTPSPCPLTRTELSAHEGEVAA